jgi:hypothetical protein
MSGCRGEQGRRQADLVCRDVRAGITLLGGKACPRMAGTGPSVVMLAASGMPAESVSQISAPEWDVVSRSGLKRKLHPGMSAQNGMNFPNEVACGSCVPDSDSRVGCRFRLRSLAEAVSRNRASEWDVLSRQELKWKLRPGFKPRNGTCFPDGLQAETVSQNRHGFKWKARLRIPRRRFWRSWLERGALPTRATTAWR